MKFIQHRVNTVEQLRGVPPEYGVELDLRDRGERLILVHDPFQDGEDFGPYLREYRHGTMILNVKSERIEPRVLEELEAAGTVDDYFFLDCSFPHRRPVQRVRADRGPARPGRAGRLGLGRLLHPAAARRRHLRPAERTLQDLHRLAGA